MHQKATYDFEVMVIPAREEVAATLALQNLRSVYEGTAYNRKKEFINPSPPIANATPLVQLLADFYITAKYDIAGSIHLESAEEVDHGPVIEALETIAPHLQEGCVFYEMIDDISPTRYRASFGKLYEAKQEYVERTI